MAGAIMGSNVARTPGSTPMPLKMKNLSILLIDAWMPIPPICISCGAFVARRQRARPVF
jgi:hypothetical protein